MPKGRLGIDEEFGDGFDGGEDGELPKRGVDGQVKGLGVAVEAGEAAAEEGKG